MKFRGIILLLGSILLAGCGPGPEFGVGRSAFRSVGGPAGAEQAEAASTGSRRNPRVTSAEQSDAEAQLDTTTPRLVAARWRAELLAANRFASGKD